MDKKVCKHCGEEKPVAEYNKAGGGKWLQPYCKPCDSERKKKYNRENKEKVKESRKQYCIENKEVLKVKWSERYFKNKDAISERSKQYRERAKDQIKERGRVYREANKEKIKQRVSEYRTQNADKIKEYWKNKRKDPGFKAKKSLLDKQYREKNAEIVKQRKREYSRGAGLEKAREWNRFQTLTDPDFKIKKNLRTRIRFALKKWDVRKVDTTQSLLGCDLVEFKKYFESLFTEGMTWEAFMAGEIWIDHIKPCVLFDLTKEEEQRACFNYRNLQPLWKIDNMRKGVSYNTAQ